MDSPFVLLFIVIALMVVLGLVATTLRSKSTTKETPQATSAPIDEEAKPIDFGVYERRQLFSKAERSFLGVLDMAVGDHFRVFAKVGLGDLFQLRKGLDASTRTSAGNRIRQKHVDFVLCSKDTLEIVCLVELDDRSHERQRTQERDRNVEAVANAAGIPLARIPASNSYAVEAVRNAVFAAIRESNE